jgi:RNA polymerase sigma-70 factor (ECF subfamily)
MRQIARNEAFRVLARKRTGEHLEADLEEAAESSTGDADRSLLRLAVRSALRQFEPEDRLLIHLRYTEDLAQPRIGELLGIPEGTVKVRLHRIRQRLRPELTDVA